MTSRFEFCILPLDFPLHHIQVIFLNFSVKDFRIFIRTEPQNVAVYQQAIILKYSILNIGYDCSFYSMKPELSYIVSIEFMFKTSILTFLQTSNWGGAVISSIFQTLDLEVAGLCSVTGGISITIFIFFHAVWLIYQGFLDTCMECDEFKS